MKNRTSNIHTSLQYFNVGPFQVKQSLPNDVLEQVSPFLLLHHAGPTHHKPGEIKSRLSPHPHRGFEPVTFLIHGKIHHKDSTGSEGFLESGDVQWMTAGSGIIHSEGPSTTFAKEGGDMELIQLWVNLPRKNKMHPPRYQDIKKENIPVITKDGFTFQVVAGEFEDVNGPASTLTPIIAMIVNFAKGSKTSFVLPQNYNAMAYVLDGSLLTGDHQASQFNLVVFKHDGDNIEIEASSNGKLLFLAGEPIQEPVVSYGPFVMNDAHEIKEALRDYENGKMGVLET